MLYRVRKTWKDSSSQLGAYGNLDNAKKTVDDNPGFKVFDEVGKVVYPTEHWADKHYQYLQDQGIDLDDKRYMDGLKRGEAFAIFHKLHQNLMEKIASIDIPTSDKPSENKPEPIEKPQPQPHQPPSKFGSEIEEIVDGDKTLVYIPFDRILEARVAIADNRRKNLTVKDFQARYGFDYVINGGFFWADKNKGYINVSVNTVFDGRNFESSGDFSNFTMLIKRNEISWGDFYRGSNTSAIGGSPSLIQEGEIKIDHTIGHENDNHPRSAIGTTADGLVFLTVDGRKPGKKGSTLKDLATYMWNLGITNAINLDGGGSTILMKKDEVLNSHLEDRSIHNVVGVWLTEDTDME